MRKLFISYFIFHISHFTFHTIAQNSTPVVDAVPHYETAVKVNLLDTIDFSNFCKRKYITHYGDSTAKDTFHLQEYFYFTIDKDGIVIDLTDERTELNQNTKYLLKQDFPKLKNLKFSPAQYENKLVETIIPLGISIEVERFRYPIKIKKHKIRIYKTPAYAEYIRKSDPHYEIIMNEYNKSQSDTASSKSKKFTLVLLDGKTSIYEMEVKEYNPFHQKIRDLYSEKFKIITEFFPIK